MTDCMPLPTDRRVHDLERFVRHIIDSCDTIEALATHSGENWREVFQLYARELRLYALRHLPADETATAANDVDTDPGLGAADRA